MGWPGNPGGKGTVFDLNLDNTILLAEAIATDLALLNTFPTLNQYRPSLQKLVIEKARFGTELYKKLKHHSIIAVYAAYSPAAHSWQIHFYPA